MGGHIIPSWSFLSAPWTAGGGEGIDHMEFRQLPNGFFYPHPRRYVPVISGVTTVRLRRVTLKHARSGVTASNKAQVLPVGITVIKAPY